MFARTRSRVAESKRAPGARLVLASAAALALLAPTGVPHARAGEPLPARQARIFAQSCAHCHAAPGLGVPVVGDSSWAERARKGLDALLVNTIEGVGNMPPLGTCGYCSEEDFRILVRFLMESGS